jgi:hypothetical protein
MTFPQPIKSTVRIKIIVGGFCLALLLLTGLAQRKWSFRARVNLLLEGYIRPEIIMVDDLHEEPVESPLGLGTSAFIVHHGSYVGVLDREGSFVSLKPGHKYNDIGFNSWRKSAIVIGCIQFFAGFIFVVLLFQSIRCRVRMMS